MAYAYVGTELDLFAGASHWKAYLRRLLSPYLGPEVLEVGAGLGGTTQPLCRADHLRWVGLEPDPALASRLEGSIRDGHLPACCSVEVGTLAEGAAPGPFDAILYVDVLEHIADDSAELLRASERLRPGGRIIAVAPAHPWLYAPFDAAVGHHRRYTRASLAAIAPPSLERVRLDYVDSVGLLASLGNRLLLRRAMPTPGQVALWDRAMVPLSRIVDPWLGRRLGKSVLAVWRRG